MAKISCLHKAFPVVPGQSQFIYIVLVSLLKTAPVDSQEYPTLEDKSQGHFKVLFSFF